MRESGIKYLNFQSDKINGIFNQFMFSVYLFVLKYAYLLHCMKRNILIMVSLILYEKQSLPKAICLIRNFYRTKRESYTKITCTTQNNTNNTMAWHYSDTTCYGCRSKLDCLLDLESGLVYLFAQLQQHQDMLLQQQLCVQSCSIFLKIRFLDFITINIMKKWF